MLKRKIYFKKINLFQYHFFNDKECTEQIVETIKNQDLYILLKNGDILPLLQLSNLCSNCKIFVPYLPSKAFILTNYTTSYYTLDNGFEFQIQKYLIKEKDATLLYLYDKDRFHIDPQGFHFLTYDKLQKDGFSFNIEQPVYIVLKEGTRGNLEKSQEIAKELKQHYQIKKVYLIVRDCLVNDIYIYYSSSLDNFYNQTYEEAYDELCSHEEFDMTKEEYKIQFGKEKEEHKQECFIDKIISTNSTGILNLDDTLRYPQDKDTKLEIVDSYQIMDCKDSDSIYKDSDFSFE